MLAKRGGFLQKIMKKRWEEAEVECGENWKTGRPRPPHRRHAATPRSFLGSAGDENLRKRAPWATSHWRDAERTRPGFGLIGECRW